MFRKYIGVNKRIGFVIDSRDWELLLSISINSYKDPIDETIHWGVSINWLCFGLYIS